jgi:hypothetical protein
MSAVSISSMTSEGDPANRKDHGEGAGRLVVRTTMP